jgi:hypothetical protein
MLLINNLPKKWRGTAKKDETVLDIEALHLFAKIALGGRSI